MNWKQQRKILLEQQRREQQWSARQAQKQMQFQERMSSTAHQREVKDLQAAGLNPVLSAGGTGAASAAGSMADVSSIIPELGQAIASAVGAAHGGGTHVTVNNEQPEVETPSSYFTAKQIAQGIHANQGAHHGSARSAERIHRDLNNARSELWDSIKDVTVGLRMSYTGKVMPTASAKGEDLHKIYKAISHYNRATKSAVQAGLHKHASANEFHKDLNRMLNRIDPEQRKKIQDMIWY